MHLLVGVGGGVGQDEVTRAAVGVHRRQAEAEAADAIDYAEWAVDNAQLAMLDAIDARTYADQLAKRATT